jgi:hypothetical protein
MRLVVQTWVELLRFLSFSEAYVDFDFRFRDGALA